MGKTLFDKIWDSHVIKDLGNGFVLLHIDRLLLHDLSGARALRDVVEKGYTPAQPRLIYATPDHAISTQPGRTDETFPPGAPLLRGLRENTAKFGIKLFDIGKVPAEGISLGSYAAGEARTYRFTATFSKESPNSDQGKVAKADYEWDAVPTS